MKIFLSFDLAGAEWVIVAHLTGDPNMLRVATGTGSPHVATASLMFGVPEDYVKMEEKALEGCTLASELAAFRKEHGVADRPIPATNTARQAGKMCNHALNYGLGWKKFAERVSVPAIEAKRLISLYRGPPQKTFGPGLPRNQEPAYPGILAWHEAVQEQVACNGYLVNCFERRRDFYSEPGPELWTDCYAYLPQSTVFDVTRIGMVRLYDQEPYFELLMQVHDEVAGQAEADPALLTDLIPRAIDHLSVPLTYTGAVDGIERTFTLGVDCKIGFSKNKRLMVGARPGDDMRGAIDKALALVGRSGLS